VFEHALNQLESFVTQIPRLVLLPEYAADVRFAIGVPRQQRLDR
jgi:hypothetical protein